jgi:hypothetical protein
MRIFYFYFIICISPFYTIAQKKENTPIKFGTVTPIDFKPSAYAIDSNADAVLIAEVGAVNFKGNTNGALKLVQNIKRRIHILKKGGFDAADIVITLFKGSSDEERITALSAATYILEGNKVVTYEVKKDAVFREELSKNFYRKKFTFPNLKEGAIIEYSYTLESPYFETIDRWKFQSEYPKLWSEYIYAFPAFLDFKPYYKGNSYFDITEKKTYNESFIIWNSSGVDSPDQTVIEDMTTETRLVKKNVPALKKEPYTSSLSNYLSSIEFQFLGYNFKSRSYIDKRGDWNTIFKNWMDNDYFGNGFYDKNTWMDNVLNPLLKDTKNELEKAKIVFDLVKKTVKYNGIEEKFIQDSHKKTFENGNGSIADINLLLMAMLKHAKLKVEPVVLSTVDNGRVYFLAPVSKAYNYIICQLTIDGVIYLLDASSAKRTFGKLPSQCYNGLAMIVDPMNPRPILLAPDSVLEKKSTTIIAALKTKGKIEGKIKTIVGDFEAENKRHLIADNGIAIFTDKLKKAVGNDVEISHLRLDSLNQLNYPLEVNYDFAIEPPNENLIYLTPLLGEAYKANPFSSTVRSYPIEFESAQSETISFSMFIPEGYSLEEKPESVRVNLNENDGFFEYLVQADATMIQIINRVKINKAKFGPEEYDILRAFYTNIIKKQAEQIVFKKIK